MIVWVLIAATGAGIGWWRWHAGVQWGRTLLVACTVATVVLSSVHIWRSRKPLRAIAIEVQNQEIAYEHLAGRRLGLELARRHPHAAIAIVLPPSHLARHDYDAAAIHGLKEGLGAEANIVFEGRLPTPRELADLDATDDSAYDKIDQIDTRKQDQLYQQFLAGLVDEHGAQIIIAATALPRQMHHFRRLLGAQHARSAARPALALLRLRHPHEQRLLDAGIVVAAVKMRPDPQYDRRMPTGDADFDKRFSLVVHEPSSRP